MDTLLGVLYRHAECPYPTGLDFLGAELERHFQSL
jgi:hypothetical protein